MGVAVDEAGNGHHAGAVNNGLGLLLGSGFFNGHDLAVCNADIGAEEHVHFGIHGHSSDVGNQGIQGNHPFRWDLLQWRGSRDGGIARQNVLCDNPPVSLFG